MESPKNFKEICQKDVRRDLLAAMDGSHPGVLRRITLGDFHLAAEIIAALLGREVLTKDSETTRIRIAFQAQEEKFEVVNPAIQKKTAWKVISGHDQRGIRNTGGDQDEDKSRHKG